MANVSLCGLTADEILELIKPAGFTVRHSLQIANAIYKKRLSGNQQANKLSKSLKQKLSDISVPGLFLPGDSVVSKDGSVKYLFGTDDGKFFETVYIPEEKRRTVCVSTQSGCRMGCSFCATAKYGYRGNLTVGEIINQIISIPQAGEITHVVFMGMGEPLDNLENVLKACRILTSEWGLSISPKNITVSTVGIMPEVEQFLLRSDCNLTLSLFSPFPDEREKVVPAERLNPAGGIVEVMKKSPVKKKRRLSIAYIMLNNINDTDDHLKELKRILKDSVIRVNLLSYHPVPDDKNCTSSAERMQYFKHNLVVSGISSSIRKSRGTDISAACGLLATGLKKQMT
jgi:23S rRNA (adenine2503-C2)-methyltransferase